MQSSMHDKPSKHAQDEKALIMENGTKEALDGKVEKVTLCVGVRLAYILSISFPLILFQTPGLYEHKDQIYAYRTKDHQRHGKSYTQMFIEARQLVKYFWDRVSWRSFVAGFVWKAKPNPFYYYSRRL